MSKEFKGLTLGAIESMGKPNNTGGSSGFALAVLLPLFIAIDVVLFILHFLLSKKESNTEQSEGAEGANSQKGDISDAEKFTEKK